MVWIAQSSLTAHPSPLLANSLVTTLVSPIFLPPSVAVLELIIERSSADFGRVCDLFEGEGEFAG